jgi:tripartite-type tricarboxylate transporter receptor subunit TctC
VAVAVLRSQAGVDVLEVPYKSGPQAASDVLGGQISFLFADFAVAFPQIRSGKLKAFGVTAASRISLMPELPALAEEIPGFDVIGWNGIVAPAGTPREAINRLAEAALKAVAAQEVSDRLRALGFEPAPMGPDAMGDFIVKDTAEWARRVKAAGIEPE